MEENIIVVEDLHKICGKDNVTLDGISFTVKKGKYLAGAVASVMPEEFTLVTTPEPLDRRVKIAETPARLVVVLRFSSDLSETHFEKVTKKLLSKLIALGIKLNGNVFTILYNPPFIPGFLRRNEVAVEVDENNMAI